MKGSERFWCLLEQVNHFWADLVVWGQFACCLDHTVFPIFTIREKPAVLGKPMETCNQFGCQLLDGQLICKNKVEYIFRVFSKLSPDINSVAQLACTVEKCSIERYDAGLSLIFTTANITWSVKQMSNVETTPFVIGLIGSHADHCVNQSEK